MALHVARCSCFIKAIDCISVPAPARDLNAFSRVVLNILRGFFHAGKAKKKRLVAYINVLPQFYFLRS